MYWNFVHTGNIGEMKNAVGLRDLAQMKDINYVAIS